MRVHHAERCAEFSSRVDIPSERCPPAPAGSSSAGAADPRRSQDRDRTTHFGARARWKLRQEVQVQRHSGFVQRNRHCHQRTIRRNCEMETMARIGPSIRIKGEVISREPLTISGHVDATIDADGHPLTVDDGGKVTATITAHTIVVAGKVHGSLCADARIIVRETAMIDGDLSAPAVSLAEGAQVQGRVETAVKKKALSLAS